MNTILSGGVLLGVLTTIWMFVMGVTGWYRDPVLLNAFFLVILIEMAVIVWALRRTAPTRGYGGQVGAGLLISIIGGVIIIAGSLLFTTVAFPTYFDDLQAMQRQLLEQAGTSADEIQAQLDAAARMNTPVVNALTGFVGTVVTGLIVSLVAAIFLRRKPPAPRAMSR